MGVLKSRRRMLLVAVVGAAALAVFFLMGGENKTDRDVLAKIMNSGGNWFSAQDLVPGDWDTACRLDPYSFASNRLPVYLPGFDRGMTYVPEDRGIDEEEIGIAFVDTRNRNVLVVVLPNAAIYDTEGERCLERESAYLRLRRVDALNKSYRSLIFGRGLDV